jgi:hypothetical protein
MKDEQHGLYNSLFSLWILWVFSRGAGLPIESNGTSLAMGLERRAMMISSPRKARVINELRCFLAKVMLKTAIGG